MDATKAQTILNKIVKQIFGYDNPLDLEQFKEKFAFDVRLPKAVTDIQDNRVTWTSTTNPEKYTKFENLTVNDTETEGILAKQAIDTIDDVIGFWEKVNVRATERKIDSTNIAESDGVVECVNIYHSQDIGTSSNILFSDGMSDCEFLAASQRCRLSSFCIRLEDSIESSNSFGISCCSKIVRSFMMHSCYDMQDSMFCTGLTGRRYCIANMQFEKDEYLKIKEMVLQWILPQTPQKEDAHG